MGAILAATCLAVIVWMGLGWDGLRAPGNYQGKKGDYYSSEVHGFLSGHLYLDKDKAHNPFLLDASFYQGHYYLYFGVTPAALVLLPYAWVTGADLEPKFVVVLGAGLGFLFSLGTLRLAARDHLGRLAGWFQLAAIPLLAFGTAVPLLLSRAMFYEVPIASGYACSMAGAFWIYRGLFGHGRPARQWALAGLSLGLAVGCRPDLVLNVPLLGLAAFLSARWKRAEIPWRRGFQLNAAAALAPAALVGAGLALYNYERFGSIFEFGINYSQNFFIGTHLRLFSATYLWPNVHWYYLTFPALSPFFPYVFPENAYFGPVGYAGGEAFHGQFPAFVLAAFALGSGLLLGTRLRLGRLAAYLGVLAWMFAALFAAMCATGVRADRYMVDFQPPLALGTVLLAGSAAAVLGRGLGPWLWRAAFVLLAAAVVAFNLFAGLQNFEEFKNTRSPAYRALERWGNFPSYWLQKAGGLKSGPVELKVVFPANPKRSQIEPLLTMGSPEYSDSLYAIERAGGRQIELLGDHRGQGGPTSEVIDITPGREYTLRVDMGALYPPLGHPFFAPYGILQARQLKTRISVELDGKPVLGRKMNSYDAAPWSLELGSNTVSMTPYKTAFTGRIAACRRLPPPAPEKVENNGLWRFRCTFPLDRPNASFPLLSAGVTGAGTLVYLNVLPGGRVRFGVDEWGAGGSFSETFDSLPQSEHVVELYIGPLVRAAHWPADWGVPAGRVDRFGHSLRLWLDGRLVWTTPLHLLFDPTESRIDVGANLQGFSSTPPDYPSSILFLPYSETGARDFLERNLASMENDGLWRLRCTFPLDHPNENFPLVSAGVQGAGTLVYLGVLPGNRVQFGIDEWGAGRGVSEPVVSAPGAEHLIEVYVGPLARKADWPRGWAVSGKRLGGLEHVLRLWLDGRLVWTAPLHLPFDPTESRFDIGSNLQGFGSVQPDFPASIQLLPYPAARKQEFLDRNLAVGP